MLWDIVEFHFDKTGTQNPGTICLCREQPIRQLLRTEVHVFSDTVLCVENNNTFPN